MNTQLLLITGSFPPQNCGVGDYTSSLASALAQCADMSVTVLTSAVEGHKEDSVEGKVRVLRVMRNWNMGSLGVVRKYLREISPNLIHIQFPTQGFGRALLPCIIPLTARLTGARVVQTWHEPFGPTRAPALALLALSPSKVVVVRPNYLQTVIPALRWLAAVKRPIYIESASSIPLARLTRSQKARWQSRFAKNRKILVFFGFIYPAKGVHHVFDFADPNHHHIVIAGAVPEDDSYLQSLMQRANKTDWRGNVSFEGSLPAPQVAEMLASADAVFLPFEPGGGEWNSSLQAAQLNGAFVLTTSLRRTGYDASNDTFYCRPGDTCEMRAALEQRLNGTLIPDPQSSPRDTWSEIAKKHISVYRSLYSGETAKEHGIQKSDINS